MGLSLSNQCAMLGYDLHYWQIDVWGVKHRYNTSNFRAGKDCISGIWYYMFNTVLNRRIDNEYTN